MLAVLQIYYAALRSLSVLSYSTLWKSTTPLYSTVGYVIIFYLFSTVLSCGVLSLLLVTG